MFNIYNLFNDCAHDSGVYKLVIKYGVILVMHCTNLLLFQIYYS